MIPGYSLRVARPEDQNAITRMLEVSYNTLMRDSYAAGDIAHIRHFGTHPDWAGRGVGRALFERCAEAARLQDVIRFECYSSLNGERFYAALGFERKSPIDIPIRPALTLPSVLMECKI